MVPVKNKQLLYNLIVRGSHLLTSEFELMSLIEVGTLFFLLFAMLWYQFAFFLGDVGVRRAASTLPTTNMLLSSAVKVAAKGLAMEW